MRMFWKYFEMLRVQKTVNKHAINNTVSSHSGLIPSKTVDKKGGITMADCENLISLSLTAFFTILTCNLVLSYKFHGNLKTD